MCRPHIVDVPTAHTFFDPPVVHKSEDMRANASQSHGRSASTLIATRSLSQIFFEEIKSMCNMLKVRYDNDVRRLTNLGFVIA
jgi:hypothetical protein